MYPNEILFADKFLAKLKLLGVDSIPFRTKEYRNGVRAMKLYYREHNHVLDDDLSDISLLFLNNGEKDFADAIMEANGDRISLKNPRLERATLQMTTNRAHLALEDHELDIPDDFMEEITQTFCEHAFQIDE